MPVGVYNHRQTKTPIYTIERGKKISKALTGIKRPYLSGEKASNWKGGRYKEKTGYIVCNDGINKKRREHRVLMERFLGRKLKREEFIHHIDGNKSNNNINNFYLCSISEHRKIHYQMEKITYELYKIGLVIFDKELGKYKMVK